MNVIKKVTMLVVLGLYLFSFLTAKGLVLRDLAKPDVLKVYNDTILISEPKTGKIFVFNALNAEIISTIGALGIGPSEFASIQNFQMSENQVIVMSPNKVSFFHSNGKLIKEIRHTLSEFGVGSLKIKNKWFGSEGEQIGKDIFVGLYLYDSNFLNRKEIYKSQIWSSSRSTIMAVEKCTRGDAFKERLIIANTEKGFYFSIFSPEGKLIRTIEIKNYPKTEVSGEWKEYIIKRLKSTPIIADNWDMIKNRIDYPEYFPAFINYAVSEGGLILVRTYVEKEGKSLYLLLNEKGKILKNIYLPNSIEWWNGQLHFGLNDKYCFYISENDDGDFELHRIPLK